MKVNISDMVEFGKILSAIIGIAQNKSILDQFMVLEVQDGALYLKAFGNGLYVESRFRCLTPETGPPISLDLTQARENFRYLAGPGQLWSEGEKLKFSGMVNLSLNVTWRDPGLITTPADVDAPRIHIADAFKSILYAVPDRDNGFRRVIIAEKTAIATDGIRSAFYPLPGEGWPEKLSLPVEFASKLREDASLFANSERAWGDSGGLSLCSPLEQGPIPQIFMDVARWDMNHEACRGWFITDRNMLISYIRALYGVSQVDEYRRGLLGLKGDWVSLEAKGQGFGRGDAIFEVEKRGGEDFEIMVQLNYLHEVLEVLPAGRVILGLHWPLAAAGDVLPLVIMPEDKTSFHFIMPMHYEEGDK